MFGALKCLCRGSPKRHVNLPHQPGAPQSCCWSELCCSTEMCFRKALCKAEEQPVLCLGVFTQLSCHGSEGMGAAEEARSNVLRHGARAASAGHCSRPGHGAPVTCPVSNQHYGHREVKFFPGSVHCPLLVGSEIALEMWQRRVCSTVTHFHEPGTGSSYITEPCHGVPAVPAPHNRPQR